MVENNRVFALTMMESKAELLAHFSAATWPLCAAFQLGKLLFVVNRQTTIGAPEFSVIRNGQQIATLPLGRLSREQVSTILDRLFAGGGTGLGGVTLILEPISEHRCSFCHDCLTFASPPVGVT